MEQKSILITGGAGFIGVNACLRFAELGWHVIALDNLSRKGSALNRQLLDRTERCSFVQANIVADRHALRDVCESVDAVLHLAGQVAVTTSVADPRSDFEANALGTLNVLEACRLSSKKPTLLFASTNKVYGGLEEHKASEDSTRYSLPDLPEGVSEREPLDFHSPYGCSKGAADQYVRDYARLYNMNTVVFRQSCVYGPHQMGVEDQGWVAWFLIAAMLGKPVQVYGTGKQVRDLLFVDDLIDAYVVALENIEAVSGKVFNMGGGMSNTLSLLEFLSHLKTDLDLSMDYSFADWRPGDQPVFVSNNAAFTAATGWQPRTDVKGGIRQLHGWLQDNWEQIEKLYQVAKKEESPQKEESLVS